MQNKGFTLIETLLVAGISTLLLLSFFSFTFLFSKNLNTAADRMLKSGISLAVMQRIITDVQESRCISLFSDDQILILEYPTGFLSYDFYNKKVRRSKNGTNSYITEEKQLAGLSFSYPLPKSVCISIKTEFGILTAEAGVRN